MVCWFVCFLTCPQIIQTVIRYFVFSNGNNAPNHNCILYEFSSTFLLLNIFSFFIFVVYYGFVFFFFFFCFPLWNYDWNKKYTQVHGFNQIFFFCGSLFSLIPFGWSEPIEMLINRNLLMSNISYLSKTSTSKSKQKRYL